MNGAIYESTLNVFFKLKYEKIYDAILATPLVGRRTSRSARSAGRSSAARLYALGFMVVDGPARA